MKFTYRGMEFEFASIPSPADLQAAYEARVEAIQSAAQRSRLAIERYEYEDEAPVSSGQRRLWFLQRMEPESTAYAYPRALRMEGALDIEALRHALTDLVARHEILRTVLIERDGEPFQKILPAPERVGWKVEDLSGRPDPEASLAALKRDRVREPFDLATEPPLRIELVRMGPDRHELLLLFHHAAMDRWSDLVLRRELTELYGARAEERAHAMAPVSIQYADYSFWERDQQKTEAFQESLEFWADFMDGAPSGLQWPMGEDLSPGSRPVGTVEFQWTAATTRLVDSLSEALDLTAFEAGYAVFQAFLARDTGQTDLVVSTPVTMRQTPELQVLIGFFANTVPVRVRVKLTSSFREWAKESAAAWRSTLRHQRIPFHEITEASRRRNGRAITFDTSFTLQHELGETVASARVADVEITPSEIGQQQIGLALSLEMSRSAEGLNGVFYFDAERFQRESIVELSERFAHFVKGCFESPDRSMLAHSVHGPDEHDLLIVDWARGRAVAGADVLVHRLFEQRASEAPDAVAIAFEGGVWSYNELNDRANRLADLLIQQGVRPGVAVGVEVTRSPELIAALYAVLKAGGTYVALQPSLPDKRLKYMVENAGVAVTLTDDLDRSDRGGRRFDIVAMNEARYVSSNPDVEVDPQDLAYILYTSGSTGLPKGVMLPHRAVANLVGVIAEQYPEAPGDAILQKTPYSFDISVSEIFNPLASGARLVMTDARATRDPAYLRDLILEHGVSVLRVTPTELGSLMDTEGIEACGAVVKRILACGEALTPAVCAKVQARWPEVELINLWGPTEACVYASWWPFDPAHKQTIPIGKALPNYTLYSLDGASEPTPVEMKGELFAGGPSLARGYHGLPGKTALAYRPDPHAAEPGARMYASGDLVSWNRAGDLEFHGRKDNQIQLRGMRIELGELESALDEHAGVRLSAVRSISAPDGRVEALVAYVVFNPGHAPEVSELRAHLAEYVEESKIPGQFVELDEMPLTASGKIDRTALPEPDAALRSSTRVLPRTETEQKIATVWRAHLELEEVGVHENFFEVGGHSLLAVRLQRDLGSSLDLDIPLIRLIETPTIAALAEWVDLQEDAGVSRIPRHDYGDEAPASSEQRRMWFLQNLAPDSVAYQVPLPVKLRGALDLDALQRAVRALMERHEVLRTVYLDRNGEPVQQISAVPEVLPWTLEDLSDTSEPDRLARERVEAAIATPFDLRDELPIRVSVFKLSEDAHILLLLFHHIAIDEWTTGVVVGELSELYAAHSESRDSRLIPLPVQYADYAIWQREQFGGPAHTEGLEFWKEHLSGAASHIEWPLGADGTDGSHPSETIRFEWNEATSGAFLQYSRAQKSSAFTSLYGAFAAFVARISGQTDLTVGLPVTMRQRPELQGLVGFLLNTIPMRARVGLGDSFEAWLAQNRATWQQAIAHHWIPLEEIVRAARTGGQASGVPLFDTVFTFVPAEGLGSFAGLEAEPLEAVELPEAKVALWVTMSEADGVLSGSFEFDSARFDRADVEQLVELFEAFVAQCIERPEAPMLAHPLLRSEKRRPLLVDWAQGRSVGGVDTPVHQLFEQCAASAPEDIAIASEQGNWTYDELNRRANRLANLLRSSGVTTGTTVGVEVERSPELIAALYGVLKAGGTYVALQPSLPDKRLAYMVEDASVQVTLTDDPSRNELGGQRLDIAAMHDGAYSDANLDVALDPEDLAYVLYTSGSTGLPKGVMLPHRAVANLVGVIAEQYPEGAHDAILQKTPYSFDISVSEIFNPLAHGARLVMTQPGATKDPGYLRDKILEERVTVLRMTPTELGSLMDTEGIEACGTVVKRILACGEALTPAVCRKVYEKWPEADLINLWGPTEACVYASWWPFDPADPETIPIGKPLPNYRLYSLDDAFEPTPLEMKGELFAGGPGLARGYHGLPGKTALAYRPDPHAEQPGARMYASGDLVSWNRAGDLEFHGRKDNQIQLRGMRIELGELESALDEHEGVRLSAVRPISAPDGRVEALVAYVVLNENHEPEVSELRAHMLGYVEESKIPGQFVRLEQMPLTPSGKIDRKALPEPDASLRSATRVLPHTETEESIASVWREQLNLEEVGVHENFFEIGGHSLLAVRVLSQLRDVCGVEISVSDVFTSPTVAGIAAVVDRKRSEQEEDDGFFDDLFDEIEDLDDEQAATALAGADE